MVLYLKIYLLLLLLFGFLSSCVTSTGKLCGDNWCHCHNKTAVCINENLTYIPKLPNKIEELNFTGKLSRLSYEILEPLAGLKIRILRILSSGVRNLTSDAFSGLPWLQELDLSGNLNISEHQLLKSFQSIQRTQNLTLVLDRCGLNNISLNFFEGLETSNVTNITMRSNHMLKFYVNTYHKLKTLKHLDLSINWLKNVSIYNYTVSVQSNIETLRLTDNEFYLFPPPLCYNDTESQAYFPNLKVLDYGNNFITVPRANDWHCLKKLEILNLSRNAVQILENDVFYALESLKTLELSQMLRRVDIIYPRAFNITSLKELRFQNNIEVFKPESNVNVNKLFMDLPKLEELDISRNNLEYLNGSIMDVLAPLKHLRELNLLDTNLNEIPADIFIRFENLTKLNLGRNSIERVAACDYTNATSLTSLVLSNNKIQEIEEESLPDELLKSLIEIDLSNNPFACNECGWENIWFRSWIDKYLSQGKNLIGWPDMYICHTPMAMSKKLLANYNPNPDNCKSNEMLIPYITIAVFVCLLIIFGSASYRGRWYIRYWVIKLQWRIKRINHGDPERRHLLSPKEEPDYDAYVIYHDADAPFVANKFVSLMEEQMKYRLFIRDREPEMGAKVDIMVESIYKSNNVIAVISRRFLKDPWCEFQLAVSLDRQVELKKSFLLLVHLDDLDKSLLSKSWCVLFTKMPTAEWCYVKNSIKRKVFERQIQTYIPNKRFPRQLSQSGDVDN